MLPNVKNEIRRFPGVRRMNRDLNLHVEAKTVSGFILDILCIPVVSPKVYFSTLCIDNFHEDIPSDCPALNNTGHFSKYHLKSPCCTMQMIYSRHFDQFIKFLVVRRADVTKMVYASPGLRMESESSGAYKICVTKP
jgi:hypothetical protein